MYPIYVLQVSTSPTFHSVSLYDQPFLALLCATAQQSYCRHAGVTPSVHRP